MFLMSGWNSAISAEVRRIVRLKQDEHFERFDDGKVDVTTPERFLFCQGVLHGKSALMMSEEDIWQTAHINMNNVIDRCERVLGVNSKARICIIGSESGIVGSFDRFYAAAKAGIHQYVETRRLLPGQQLVAIAPNVISDAGMTLRRADVARLEQRRLNHPQRRFCTSAEVAEAVVFLLYGDRGYINNTVVRMNGGEHAK